ncbi:MAG: GFA family protein, partial [Pseudomonadales bacterium]
AITGGCNCRRVRYRISSEPLFTHVCHCHECQRESGGAFHVSTVIVGADFSITSDVVDEHTVVRPSGNEYKVYECQKCSCTIAGHSIDSNKLMVVRPSTFDDTSLIQPQAHIWTREKQGWVVLPQDVPVFSENYDAEQTWPADSLARMKAALG